MKTFATTTALLAALLLMANTPLWAGGTRSIAVSCVVQPRILAQMPQESQALTEEAQLPSKGNLLQQKEYRKTDLPANYDSLILYSYCER